MSRARLILLASALGALALAVTARSGHLIFDAGTAQANGPRDVARFSSRSDLRPPRVEVTRRPHRTARGYVFVAPKGGAGQTGPMIVDGRGGLVWFRPLRHMIAMDFRVQRYQGKPVLTWWQGRPVRGWGRGELVIADRSYRTIARVRAVGPYEADHHDSLITPRGTALITVYRPVRMSMAAVGGPPAGTVMEAVVQEIDIATGRLVHEWSSLPEIGLRESYKEPARSSAEPYDYFHINSVQLERDGNLVISARNTHAVYEIDRGTGALIWRLGGKRSDFKMGRGTRFAWQHDARFHGATLTIFDNEAAPEVRDQSRGISLRVNRKRRRVTLRRQYVHPGRLLAKGQANMQLLPHGHVFIGWGSAPYLSEYSRRGHLLFDMRHLGGTNSYRAYRFRWTGRPETRPSIAVRGHGRRTTVYASWNGATGVARWRVVSGRSPDALRPIATGRRSGFETGIRVRPRGGYVAVEAVGRRGRALATSKPVRYR